MAFPATDLAQVVAGEYVDENDYNSLIDGLNFLADPPACRVYNSANVSIPNNSATSLTFNSERYDTDSMHSTSSNTSRITFNTAGLYVVSGTIQLAADSDYTLVQLGIQANSSTNIALIRDMATVNDSRILTVTTVYKFAAADFVELQVRQVNTSAAANNVLAVGNYSPEFSATWIGRG